MPSFEQALSAYERSWENNYYENAGYEFDDDEDEFEDDYDEDYDEDEE